MSKWSAIRIAFWGVASAGVATGLVAEGAQPFGVVAVWACGVWLAMAVWDAARGR